MTDFGPGFEVLLSDLDRTVWRYNLDMRETLFVFSQVCKHITLRQAMTEENANHELYHTLVDITNACGSRIRKAVEFMLLSQEVPDALYEPPDEEELEIQFVPLSFEEFKEITGIDLDQLFQPEPVDPHDVN